MGLIILAVANPAIGGSLKDREKEIKTRSTRKKEQREEKKKESHHYSSSAYSPFGSGTYPSSGRRHSFFGDFWAWLVIAPFEYRHRDPAYAPVKNEDGTWSEEPYFIFPEHREGEPTVPFARLDYNRQFSDWDADDVRLELGYKLAGVQIRMTRFTDEVGDDLHLSQYYAVFRYGGRRPDFVPGTFEIGFGAGVVHHGGDVTGDTSGAITLPIKYHPADWCGFEFRPAWYKWDEITIGDYDISASVGHRYIQLRGGYRWFQDNGVVDEQSGPYLGTSFSF